MCQGNLCSSAYVRQLTTMWAHVCALFNNLRAGVMEFLMPSTAAFSLFRFLGAAAIF